MLYIHIKPYESKLSTALYECKAVARCATRKIYSAINIKNSRTLANNFIDTMSVLHISYLPIVEGMGENFSDRYVIDE